MPSIYPTRSQRLEKIVRKITTAYRSRKLRGRATDRIIVRLTRLTQAYCDAMEAERSA